MDVFKALIKRICVDQKIDIKLTSNLNSKLKKQWGKKHKLGQSTVKTRYSAQ